MNTNLYQYSIIFKLLNTIQNLTDMEQAHYQLLRIFASVWINKVFLVQVGKFIRNNQARNQYLINSVAKLKIIK